MARGFEWAKLPHSVVGLWWNSVAQLDRFPGFV